MDAKTKMTQILELSEKYFKVAIMKILQWVIMNTLVTNEKIVLPRNRTYKIEPNRYFRTEVYNNQN